MSSKIDKILQRLKISGETLKLGKDGQIYLRYDKEKGVWRYSSSYTREKYGIGIGEYLLSDRDAEKTLKKFEIYNPVKQLKIEEI